jgi:RHS repeat-associated protein
MSVEYYLGDHLGSTSITTDSSGAKVSELRYKPFGEVRYAWTSAPVTTPSYSLTRFTYTGQYTHMDDPTTAGVTEGFGLMFYNARWYDPTLGRFAQADTIVPAGVQGLDRYAYVNNSPMNFVDPSGHIACDGELISLEECRSGGKTKGNGNGEGGGDDEDNNIVSDVVLDFDDGQYEIIYGTISPDDLKVIAGQMSDDYFNNAGYPGEYEKEVERKKIGIKLINYSIAVVATLATCSTTACAFSVLFGSSVITEAVELSGNIEYKIEAFKETQRAFSDAAKASTSNEVLITVYPGGELTVSATSVDGVFSRTVHAPYYNESIAPYLTGALSR